MTKKRTMTLAFSTGEKQPLRSTNPFILTAEDCETVEGDSMTVPDDSYTIREIIEKSGMGIDTQVQQPGEYIPDSDHDDIDLQKLSRSEQHDIADRLQDAKQILAAKIEEDLEAERQSKAAKAAEDLKALKKQLIDELKAEPKTPKPE